MVYNIEHTTTYSYSGDVRLDPHIVRLTPQSNAHQRLLKHQLLIEPTPKGMCEMVDAEGNTVISVWFSEPTNMLRVTNICTVETLTPNPFNYLVTSANAKIPLVWTQLEQESLGIYLKRKEQSLAVDVFAGALLQSAEYKTVQFLRLLNQALHEDFETVLREDGDPYEPEDCLILRRGACRDLTVLFMDACRSVGLPARFVSGYLEGDPDLNQRHLHAWPEVYLPQAGWRGYDPTTNLAVADQHIAVASSYSSHLTGPIEGSFWAYQIQTTMDYEIKLESSPDTLSSSLV